MLKVPHRVEDGFRRRSAGLPAETQLLLLVAAADPTGEATLLWRAAAHLGVAPEAAAPAEQGGVASVLTITGELARAGEPAVESTAIADTTGAVTLRHSLTATSPGAVDLIPAHPGTRSAGHLAG